MRFEDLPDSTYQPIRELAAEEDAAFGALLEAISDDVPVAWRSSSGGLAAPGVWVHEGRYRLKHGSFVDPTDLSCYGAPYYAADDAGRHRCLQIGRGGAQPDDARPIETVAELRAAVAPEPASAEAHEAQEGVMPSGRRLLQPDAAFEMHGALTKGWHATLYAAALEEDADAAQLAAADGRPEGASVLVFG